MSVQDQHLSRLLSKQQLKTLLFGELEEPTFTSEGYEFEPKRKTQEYIALLNQQLNIYLAINVTAQEVAYRTGAYAVIVIDAYKKEPKKAVQALYFDYSAKQMKFKDVDPEIRQSTENIRLEYIRLFIAIKEETWRENHFLLSSVLGDERAKRLTRPNSFLKNYYYDEYILRPNVTIDESSQIQELGLRIIPIQELGK